MAEHRREWVWGALLLAGALVAVVVLAPPTSQVALDYRLSTLRTTPDGAAALYETLSAMDVAVDRRLTPLAGVDPIRGPLAILEPVESLSPAELDSLFRWVERGGRLIVSPPTEFTSPEFDDHLGLVLSYETPTVPIVTRRHPWTEGIDNLGNVSWAFRGDTLDGPALVPLVVDSATGRPLIGFLERGEGEILAIADGQLLSNGRIRTGGIAPLVVRAAAAWTPQGGALWFDEYHHGHRGGNPYAAVVGLLAEQRIGKAALQLIAVALLALIPAAIRFGAARTPRTESRRSPLEHVDALGEVYRQARAESLARRRLLAGFARRIGRDRPPPGEEAAFLERLGRHARTGADGAIEVSPAMARDASLRELADRIDMAVQQLNRGP